MARAETEADQGARIRHRLRLPAMVSLIAPHCVFACLVPRSGRIAAQVMLAYQGLLNCLRSFRFNLLLSACGFFALHIL